MDDLTITLVQADQRWENKAANFQNYEALLIDTDDTDLIILPEMFNTGFSMNAPELSETLQISPSIDWLKAIARQKNASVYTSLIFREDSRYFNRGFFVEPNGSLTPYDKQKTFGLAKEDNVFSHGNNSVVVNWKGWNIQLQICYDLRFPEISLNKHTNDRPHYDILIYIANWPTTRRDHWRSLLPARAIENQCYVVGVNRVGKDENQHVYAGDSFVFDLHGNLLADLGNTQKAQTIVLSSSDLIHGRKKLPFLKDRKS